MTIVMLNSEKRAAAAAATTTAEEAGAGAVTVIKKGPWTAAEDAVLTEYVRQNGEGNWNAVQRNTGLARCGKSCRLRWANHLRPNLKKGSFSQDEEKIIIELHAKLGNKWARMASQLPGRTDNEIKNFWNTRMKRRQRAGLPIYPHDQLQQLLLHQTLQYNSGQNLTSHNHNHNQNPLIKPITDPTNHFNFSHPIISNNSQVSQFVPLNNNHHNTISSASPYSFQYSSGNLSSMVISGAPYEPVPELPSSQTPASSSDDRASGGESYRFDDVVLGQFKRSWLGKSGLLGDLVVEGRAMSRNKRARRTNAGSPEGRGKGAAARREEPEESTENRTENFSSGDQSSIGIEHGEDPIDVSSMDDDLMSLLTNFPSSATPVPEWYSGGGDSTVLSGSEIPGIATSGADAGHDIVARNASPERKRDRSLGSCYWNNMPGIC